MHLHDVFVVLGFRDCTSRKLDDNVVVSIELRISR
jgi:hypothetical protein